MFLKSIMRYGERVYSSLGHATLLCLMAQMSITDDVPGRASSQDGKRERDSSRWWRSVEKSLGNCQVLQAQMRTRK